MKSTGEVIGLDTRLGSAFAKAEIAAGNLLPTRGTVFISVNDRDKQNIIDIAQDFQEIGFNIMATQGTAEVLRQNGLLVKEIFKVNEGRPHVVDHIKNGEIHLVVNTPLGERARDDEYDIGRAAIRHKIPAITTLSGAKNRNPGNSSSSEGRSTRKKSSRYFQLIFYAARVYILRYNLTCLKT